MNRLLTALVATAAVWASACGSSAPTVVPGPPIGKYSLASLKGTYAFMTSGEVFVNGNVSASPMQRVGSFVANGAGVITGGVEDVNTAGTPSGAIAITGGGYNIDPDGRGTLTLQFAANTLTFGMVLTSTSDGLMMDETTISSVSSQASTGSGNFIKQDTTLCSTPNTSVVGTYVFDFFGLDSSMAPQSFVGEFTSNNTGATTAAFGDINDAVAGLSSGPFNASFGTGGFPAGPTACGRGLAQLTTTVTGTQTYAYYVVDASRVRFINAAGGEMLSGDAVLQDNTVPTSVNSINGGLAFVVAGSSANGGLTRLVRVTANSGTLTNVLMDTNNAAATYTMSNGATSATISLDATNPGRGIITFLANGESTSVPSRFVFYLNSAAEGVIQETTQNINTGAVVAVADGTIAAQTGSPFSSSNIAGTYALNWSGLVTAQGSFANQDEEDVLGQVNIANLTLTGRSDAFQFTSLTLTPNINIGTAGTMALNGGDGTGGDGTRVDMDVTLSNQNAVHMVVYIANPQLAFFANRDNNGTPRIVAGVLKAQQ